MGEYYDKDGSELTFEEWGEKHHEGYKRVASTTLSSGWWVSTVWLGINHRFGNGQPLIFETMVFEGFHSGEALDDYTQRYSTLQDAERGHLIIVEELEG